MSKVFRPLFLALALVVASLLLPLYHPLPTSADITADQATVYNCDGTSWAFRATRLASGAVGLAYAYAPPGSNRATLVYSAPVNIGGTTASSGDISMACIIGKVWVFARMTAPVDGTARLYERHGYSDDLASGVPAFTDGWYHWR